MAYSEQIRFNWQRRPSTDEVIEFWPAFGLTIITCGIYGLFIAFKLAARMSEHARRRAAFLEGLVGFIWTTANDQPDSPEKAKILNELLPGAQRKIADLKEVELRAQDPIFWVIIRAVASFIGDILEYYSLDKQRVEHDLAEGEAEYYLSQALRMLGGVAPDPQPSRVKPLHNTTNRIIATIATCGIYSLWWMADIMRDTNEHFAINWSWEDYVARDVQNILTTPPVAPPATAVGVPADSQLAGSSSQAQDTSSTDSLSTTGPDDNQTFPSPPGGAIKTPYEPPTEPPSEAPSVPPKDSNSPSQPPPTEPGADGPDATKDATKDETEDQ